MRTIIAGSAKGAIKAFLKHYETASGDLLSIKRRGHGDWEEYEVE